MREATVAPSLVLDMSGYLRARGIDADAVCRRAGIDPEAVRTGAQRLPGRAMAAFWREAIAASGDPDLGLHTAVESNAGALDIVGYVMLSSRTAEEALRRGARLMHLLNDGLSVLVSRDALATTCQVVVSGGLDNFLLHEPRQVIEAVLVGIVHQLRLLTQRAVVPISVAMAHERPSSGVNEHRRLFGVAPEFAAHSNAVAIHNADVDVTLRSANPSLLAIFEAHAEQALRALGARESLAGRVSAEIMARLKGEAPSIAVVAQAMAIGPRHLQRGLAAEGTTYQALLDDARRELALRHLSAPDATVAKVAWLVGFSEPSAFHRAFRRWTGQTPRAMA